MCYRLSRLPQIRRRRDNRIICKTHESRDSRKWGKKMEKTDEKRPKEVAFRASIGIRLNCEFENIIDRKIIAISSKDDLFEIQRTLGIKYIPAFLYKDFEDVKVHRENS